MLWSNLVSQLRCTHLIRGGHSIPVYLRKCDLNISIVDLHCGSSLTFSSFHRDDVRATLVSFA